MKNIYYSFWISTIQNYLRNKKTEEKYWKGRLLFLVSTVMALFVWTIFLWLKFFGVFTVPTFYINIFPGHTLVNAIFSFIEFGLPFFILNYYLIFYKNRYQNLIMKHVELNKKVSFIIVISIISIAYLSAMLYGFLI